MQRESHVKFSVNQQKQPITRMPALSISMDDKNLKKIRPKIQGDDTTQSFKNDTLRRQVILPIRVAVTFY